MTDSDLLLAKAERFMRTAEVAATDGDLDSAASRLYYAMFYVAEALLAARGLSFSSHHAIIAAYGQHFAKTRELDPRFHQALLAAFGQRHLADYATASGLVAGDIEALQADANAFLAAARDWLARQ